MAWGKGPPSTIEEFVRRLARDDPTLTSLAILRFRRLDADDARALAAALATNTRLTELNASQHALPPQAYATIARALASNPRSGVASLSLGTGELGDAGAVALVAGLLGRDADAETANDADADATTPTNNPIINTSLRHLDLEARGLGEAAAAALAELLRWHGKLEHLDLGGNEGLGDAGARALAATTPPPPPSAAAPLRRLSLHRCGLTHVGLTHLASAPFCATLAELSLAENEGLRGEQAGAALAALAAAAPRLRRLDARATALGDEGVAAAAAGGLMERLLLAVEEGQEEDEAAAGAVLDLSSTAVAAGGCEALAAALLALPPAPASNRRRPRLALRLGHNRAIPPHAVARLASAAQGLVDELDVGGAALDAGAVKALAAARGLRHLSLFSCTGLKDDKEAVKALCEALEAEVEDSLPCFAALEHLGLAACGLDAPALKAVLDSASKRGSSRRLRCLELGGNPGVQDAVFEAAVAEARERRPSLDVAWRAGADGADGGGAGGGGGPPPALPPQLLQQQQQQAPAP